MTKYLSIKILFIAFFSLFGVQNSPLAASVDEEVIKIQKAYDSIKDIRGRFIQKSYIKDLKI